MDDKKIPNRLDVQAVELERLDWNDVNKSKSLDVVFMCAVRHAQVVIHWYLDAKKKKKQCARILRVITIALTTIAALMPLVSQMYEWISPIWSTFALGLAAMCVAFDRYFGCSNAWMRYIAAEHQVRQLLHVFQIEREELVVDWENGNLDKPQVLAGLVLTKKFIVKVDEIVRLETEQWRAEFQNTIKEIDSGTKNNKSD